MRQNIPIRRPLKSIGATSQNGCSIRAHLLTAKKEGLEHANKLEQTLQEYAALLQLIHEDVTAEEAAMLGELINSGHRVDREFLKDLPIWIACLDGHSKRSIAELTHRVTNLSVIERFGLLKSAQPNIRLAPC